MLVSETTFAELAAEIYFAPQDAAAEIFGFFEGKCSAQYGNREPGHDARNAIAGMYFPRAKQETGIIDGFLKRVKFFLEKQESPPAIS